MYASKRVRTLTASATVKLTGEEEALIREQADRCGLTKSEWCRRALLEAVKASQDTRLMLSEFMALRTVFARLYADCLQGNPPSDARLQAVLQHAEQTKVQLAEDRIEKSFARSLKPAPEPAA